MDRYSKIEVILVSVLIYFIFGITVLENMSAIMFPILNIFITYGRYLLFFAVLFFHIKNKNKIPLHKGLIIFYVVYSCFLMAYVTIFKKVPLDAILGVSNSAIRIFFDTIVLLLLIIATPTIIQNLNFRYITILMCVGVYVPALIYVNYVGIDTLQMFTHRQEGDIFVSSLTLEFACLIPMSLGIMFYKDLTTVKFFNYLFLVVCIASTTYILIVGGKRGPMLSLIIVILVLTYLRDKKSIRYIRYGLYFIIGSYLFLDPVLEMVEQVAPYTVERIRMTIYEGDTSNRINTEDTSGCFPQAIKQFASSPIWGSYFRLTSGDFRGVYPHNILLEIMITMGLLGFVPFLILLYKAFSNIKNSLRSNYSPLFVVLTIFFLCRFFMLMTSGSLTLDRQFWLSFSMVLIIPKLYDWKIKEIK